MVAPSLLNHQQSIVLKEDTSDFTVDVTAMFSFQGS